MNLAVVVGVVFAGLLHVGFLLFGGIVFGKHGPDHGTLREVDLVAVDEPKAEEAPEEAAAERAEAEQLEAPKEEAPNADEILRNLEVAGLDSAPALDASSLSAIEQALNASQGSSEMGDVLGFASGGVIGGTGRAVELEAATETAFSLAEIDQKPRPTVQTAPTYPNEMRRKKLEGVVTLIFVVDAGGRVESPKVESSTNVAFEKPALDAVKQWRFEPAVRAGSRVACRMRVPIRFQPN